jgi:hypothetical protein
VDNISASVELASQHSPTQIDIPPPAASAAVHFVLAICSAVLLGFCVLASPPGAMQNAIPLLVTVVVILAPLLIPAAYWQQHKIYDRRDAALMLPWAFVVAALIAQTALTASTFTYPLRDDLRRKFDEHLGISVPYIMAVTGHHPILENCLGHIYGWLHPMVLLAIFLPALLGKREAAQRFLLVNALGFVLALPCMVLLPAVGPWVGWNFAPNSPQHLCELAIYTLRRVPFPRVACSEARLASRLSMCSGQLSRRMRCNPSACSATQQSSWPYSLRSPL